MKIVIAGGSGFIGGPLAEAWAEEGHDVRVLTRSLPDGETRHDPGTGVPGITRVGWRGDGTTGKWADAIERADAVVNLAGESIAGKRWTAARKTAIRESRVRPTRSVVAAIRAAERPPRVLINSSATGYYGDSGPEPRTEDSPPGTGFLAEVAQAWEDEARPAESAGVRVVLLRTGVVLERAGGALPAMLLPYRFFAGGPLGNGRQYLSWIHRLDVIEMIRWLVDTPGLSGPVNATAPHPVTNRQFAKALGRAMGRPALIPAPAFALRLMLGEMAGPLLLEGQRVLPTRAQAHGYHFRYPEIDIALRGLFGE